MIKINCLTFMGVSGNKDLNDKHIYKSLRLEYKIIVYDIKTIF